MLCEGFHIEKVGDGWKLLKRLAPARKTKKANTKKKEFDAKKLRTFKGVQWRDPKSPGRCGVLCASCGACDSGKQKGAELDKEVRRYVLDYLGRLHG
jgi:uncharacterized ferredoxin-like protein